MADARDGRVVPEGLDERVKPAGPAADLERAGCEPRAGASLGGGGGVERVGLPSGVPPDERLRRRSERGGQERLGEVGRLGWEWRGGAGRARARREAAGVPREGRVLREPRGEREVSTRAMACEGQHEDVRLAADVAPRATPLASRPGQVRSAHRRRRRPRAAARPRRRPSRRVGLPPVRPRLPSLEPRHAPAARGRVRGNSPARTGRLRPQRRARGPTAGRRAGPGSRSARLGGRPVEGQRAEARGVGKECRRTGRGEEDQAHPRA